MDASELLQEWTKEYRRRFVEEHRVMSFEQYVSLFLQRPLTASARANAAQFIASRQGLPGSYAGMFAPVPGEPVKGYTTFTGEVIHSDAGTRHVLGEESCRALLLLDIPATRHALERATTNFMVRVDDAERRQYSIGTFCCGTCTCAYWRHLIAGGLNRQEERLATGLQVLRSRRLPNGRWQAFPVWYTLLALIEIDTPAAKAERQFAAPACERYLRRQPASRLALRRHRLAQQVLKLT